MNPKNSLRRFLTAILLAVTIGSLFVNFWGWDLWAPDEPRYAEVAREMLTEGNWLLPHLGGKVYSEKPPLFFWMIAVSYRIFGVNPFAVRIIPLLSAAGTIIITYYLGRRLFSPRAGLFAAMALGTSILFVHLARRGNIDSTLTLFTTASLALMVRAYFDNRPSLYLFAYLIMSLGVILKGPVAFLLPLLTLLLYLIVSKDLRSVRRAYLIGGLAILIVVLLAWLAPAAIKGGADYIKTIVLKQNIGRTLSSFSHKKPPFYYLKTFPLDFFPWIVFFPGAVYYSVRRRSRQSVFSLIWFLTIFLFFSIISGKRGLYLLPLFPASALIVGNFFDAAFGNKISPWSIRIPAILLAILFLGSAALLPFIEKIKEIPAYAGELLKFRPILISVLGIGGILLLISCLLRKHSLVFPVVFGTMLVLSVLIAVFIFPAANQFKTARFICEDLLRGRTNNEPVILFRDMTHSGAYHFYTQLPLIDLSDEQGFEKHEEKLIKLLETDRKTYIIVSEECYHRLRPETTDNLRLISSRPVGHRTIMLFQSGKNDETEL